MLMTNATSCAPRIAPMHSMTMLLRMPSNKRGLWVMWSADHLDAWDQLHDRIDWQVAIEDFFEEFGTIVDLPAQPVKLTRELSALVEFEFLGPNAETFGHRLVEVVAYCLHSASEKRAQTR